MRIDNRKVDELRSVKVIRRFTKTSAGSVLISAGDTVVLCTASIATELPGWIKPEEGKGWITAEYNMLPGSTPTRKKRDRDGHLDGRSAEIQRLIGRSLRATLDRVALGPRLITLDCDVLQADGGTRTLSITGAMIALIDALASIPDLASYPLTDSVSAVSVGLIDSVPMLDLCYQEDVRAEVDMNVAMTGSGKFIEVQGTGEHALFDRSQLNDLLNLAEKGCRELTQIQKDALGADWPF
ncbi:MAG: ribonuclease PH [Thermoguttaceae bacterium]|nr:ribonuclease PH [Thermoguttaceae bacterium]MBQ6617040.1 ribonuclease PH [Thermoguttaceae bacterium]